ncbi:MAG: cytochrome b/b6 domain-containing protein [Acetobacteraceae bacterium]|jgi:cytochrome b
MRQLYLPMRIWDLPTRLFHWILVVLIFAAWFSAWRDWMQVHVVCGLTVLTLLLFRLIWGFVGSDTARFSHFLKSPMAGLRHLRHLLRREPDTETGHNAAGGWMVILLLALLCVQVGTGLCSNDDIMVEGPLAEFVGKDRSDWLTHIHHVNFTLIEIAISLHVLAIITYRVLKGHNLLLPMITGKKRLPGATRAPRMMHPVLALAVLVFSALAVVLFLLVVGYIP